MFRWMLSAAEGAPLGLARAVLCLTLLGLIACGKVEGVLVASGQPLGDFTLELTRCTSGAHQDFQGVVLLPDEDEPGGIIAVRDMAKGDYVRVEIPGSCDPGDQCRFVALDASQCSTFDLDLEQSNTRVNLIWLIRGSLDFVCELEAGRAEAHARFEDCG